MIYLVLFFGLILRLISLNQSFWLDEATSATVASMKVNQILTVFSPGDFHPPFYYLLLHFWALLSGYSETGLRTLSILAGVGTIYCLYLTEKILKDKKSGIIAALLLATSGLHIYYSQEARMYSLEAFFVSFTILFFVKTIKKGRVGEWALFSLFLALSAFTDYLSIFIIPALWLFAWRQKLNQHWWKKFLTSHIILIVGGLLWLPYFLNQLSSGLSVRLDSPSWWQILGKTNFKDIILIPTKFIFGRINMEPNYLQASVVAFVFLVFTFLLFKSLKSWQKTKLIWFWLTVPILISSVVSFWVPTLTYFRFIFVLPAFYLLLVEGIRQLPKWWQTLVIVLLILFNLITAALYLLLPQNHREDWRGLTRFVSNSSLVRSSVVVFVANSQMEAYRYYDKDAKIATPENLTGDEDVIWLMRYVQEIFDREDKARAKIESLGYQKTEEHNFNGVIVWKYEK